ncbi:MAG: hypothetical protein Q7S37_04895 [bacterium]|nr:hypothetical protein [bacterium]
MPAILRIVPRKTYATFSEFIAATPPYSIGIDGIVAESTQYEQKGPYLNLNHHDSCDRLATRSACGQALCYMRAGLNEQFRLNGQYHAIVHANHPDEDVCTAWFVLKHPELTCQTIHPLLNRLIAVEDTMDTMAGAYPFHKDLPLLEEFAWIFEPYTRARQLGIIHQPAISEHTMIGIVTDVENRIMRHITGKGERIALDTRYTLLDKVGPVAIIEETGQHARIGLFGDGHKAYLSIQELSNGNLKVSVGRMSPFIGFNVIQFLSLCNREERPSGGNIWGGGNNVGGSPRDGGTKLKLVTLKGALVHCIRPIKA